MINVTTMHDARPRYAPEIAAGTQAYLSPYWVEVVSYSPKHKMVRYRRLSRGKVPIERMGRKAFTKVARLG